MKNLTKGKLVYMSLRNCRALRVIGRKFPDRKTGRPLSYNKTVSLLFEILTPGFLMADNVKKKILSMDEEVDKNEDV